MLNQSSLGFDFAEVLLVSVLVSFLVSPFDSLALFSAGFSTLPLPDLDFFWSVT